MKIIENKTFPNERDLYGLKDTKVINCRFEGNLEGESALKECRNIEVENCFMDLRYPLWHDLGVKLKNVTQTENCRAALWYSYDVDIKDSNLGGIKALRECENITIDNTTVDSPEFGWKSRNITVTNSSITSQYIFLLVKNMKCFNSKFYGKYGFQYMEDIEFDNCYFDTKDAFWHGKNIVVKNSVVKGEYLGWYSENLTFINCKIIGIQPLCYCTNLKLINCTMEGANFAFEYSTVEAEVNSSIESVKNVRGGYIKALKIDEVIKTDDSLYPFNAEIITKE